MAGRPVEVPINSPLVVASSETRITERPCAAVTVVSPGDAPICSATTASATVVK